MTLEEVEGLRSQTATSNKGRGGRRYAPLVFTEQGIAMLSTVLNSERAIHVNIEIMRAFVRLREMLATHKDLARKLEAMEKKYDAQFKVVFDAMFFSRLTDPLFYFCLLNFYLNVCPRRSQRNERSDSS